MVRSLGQFYPFAIRASHFRPEHHAWVHGLFASGVTQRALFDFLKNVGIDISEVQIHNKLVAEPASYRETGASILAAGLKEVPNIRTDDTGAKHQHKNGYCNRIGDEHFAYYKTTFSKSTQNFLDILSQGERGYLIYDAFIWHLFQGGVEDAILNSIESYKGKQYQTAKGLNRLLNELGLVDKKLRRLFHEAGWIGFIQDRFLKLNQFLFSKRAGEFAALDHAGCWIHAEQPLRKLIVKTKKPEAEIMKVREAIWSLYSDLKEASIKQEGKELVGEQYQKLVTMRVSSPGVFAVQGTFKDNQDEKLKALDHPGLLLHNNDTERDVRGMVKFRNASGSTKCDGERDFRDGLMTLKQTCIHLGENFWGLLKAWFNGDRIDLVAIVRQRYQADAYC